VTKGVRAMPLARYLSRAFPMCPGYILRNALKRRDVRINGARAGADALVSEGDALQVYIDERFLAAPAAVLYDDRSVLALDKPQGLPVDVDADGIGEDTLLLRARALHPEARLCHRLDAGTGGVTLFALTDDAYRYLTDAFRDHRIEKTYRCLVAGRPEKPAGELTAHLLKDAASARVREAGARAPGAMRATLKYRVIESRGETSLVEIDLGTGRTHQIRAQMAAAGHPLLGDDKYGDRGAKARGLCLWCREIEVLEGPLSEYAGRKFTAPEPDWRGEVGRSPDRL